jgi:hypothetical protein
MPLPSFDAVAKKFASSHDAPKSSLEVFTLYAKRSSIMSPISWNSWPGN